MARFEHLPIYKKSFILLVDIEKMVLNMQKRSRYTIWEDLRNLTRQFVVWITRLNSISEKESRLNYTKTMFDTINQIYILLWVTKELKLFQTKNQYENLLKQVFDIERQLEWWKKSF